MGLGKTAICLWALRELFTDGATCGALVIAPKRVATITWPEEVAKWKEFAWMKTLVLRKPADYKLMESAKHHLYVINYEQIPNLCRYYLDNRRKPLAFDTVIFDEITRGKNPSSVRMRKLRDHIHRIPRRWGLTGTPNPNSLLELWAQIRLLDDGERLGKSFHSFQNNYFVTTDFQGYDWKPRAGTEEKIYGKLKDIALVQRSSDYLNIPPTITEDVAVTLDETARRHYTTMERELLLLLGRGAEVVALTAAVLVTKLLQITSGCVYETVQEFSTGDKPWHKLHGIKLDALRKLARQRNEPLLVATNFRHERVMILEAFPEAREWHDGILPEWNAGKVRMLVADPRSIGHGLNLQAGGRTVVWFSLTYSRELYDQFNARLARKGQGQETFVYRIIALDTIDEAVALVLKHKDEGQQALLSALRNYQLMAKEK